MIRLTPIAAVLIAFSTFTPAHNGTIGHARPISGIEIDGALDDWPDDVEPIALELYSGRERDGARDFSASFRVGYDGEALYVAGEVVDDSHVVGEEADGDWMRQDSWLLYIEPRHRPIPDGNRLYYTGEKLRKVDSPLYGRDPINSGASWDGVDVAVQRKKGVTTYEWRFPLGEYLRPGRSIGFDHLLYDADEGEPDGTMARWGDGWGKSGRSENMADLLLLPADAELGTVTGQVVWARDIEDDLPDVVHLVSVDDSSTWTRAALDRHGRFEARLPVGAYRASSAHAITEPFTSGDDNQLRIDTRAGVEFTIVNDRIVQAPRLELPTYDRPDWLLSEKGLLFEEGPIDPVKMDAFVEGFREFYAIPGLSVAIVQDNEIVYRRALGTRNNATGAPVEPTTLFEAASITKPLLGYVVMRLVERGEIDLDEPLHARLPFDNLADDERYLTMTARHVLAHQTGLDNWPWGGPGTYRNGGTFTLNFAPGEGYGYSGEGTNYLARVVETITGKPIDQVVREEIFEPFGMRQSHLAINDAVIEHVSQGHDHHYPTFFAIPGEASMASSLHTEATDLARFMIGLMEGKGLKKKSYEEMWRRQLEMPDDRRGDLRAGALGPSLGFFTRDYLGHTTLEHGGNNGDFQGIMIFCPEKKAGFAMLANNNLGHKMQYALFRHLIGSK